MGYLTPLLLALPLAAQEPQPAVAVSTGTSAAPYYAAFPSTRTASGEPPAALAEAVLCLEALRHGWNGSRADLAVAISSAAAFITAGTPAALPPAEGAELERKLTDMRDRAAAAKAVRDLARLRRALQDFFAGTGGRWPSSLDELVPDYLTEIPVLDLPGHAPSSEVRTISGTLHDEDAAAAVSDTGGWLYFSDPDSDNWGLALIDCSHGHEGGGSWYDR